MDVHYKIQSHLAKYIISEFDFHCLEVPRNLKKILKQFLVTYSAESIVDQNSFEIKEYLRYCKRLATFAPVFCLTILII